MPPRKRPGRVSIDRTEYDALIELRLVLADPRMTSILTEIETLRRGKP